jgi:hypothetical protein
LAPREYFSSSLASTSEISSKTFTATLTLMNTDLENKIGVGSSDYPFPAQKEGQCLVSNV